MKIKKIQVRAFKRFHDLTIHNISEQAKLVVIVGSNGSGKSSLFDAFRVWHGFRGRGISADETYYQKKDEAYTNIFEKINIEFFNIDTVSLDLNGRKDLFYIRSAYRHQADFVSMSTQRMAPLLDSQPVNRLIDMDSVVADNYQRIIYRTISNVYSEEFGNQIVRELRENIIGVIRESMSRVFDDLFLDGVGDPFGEGTFYFTKGSSKQFHYKNLSGGEKAAFDILLDIIIKKEVYQDTIFCLDEPELHIHTKLQQKLIQEIYSLIPDSCQLWIATHSIGILREVRNIQEKEPNSTAIIDFHNRNFDETFVIEPSKISRTLWKKMLEIALEDIADLVAPNQIILCEGRPSKGRNDQKAEFDAKCYRIIFREEFPDIEFISVGSSSDVIANNLDIEHAIQTIVRGTKIFRVVDRDDRTEQEIMNLLSSNIKVLSRRHIESYLLDDEVLTKLCMRNNNQDKISQVLEAKEHAISSSVNRNNPDDDIKSAAGEIYNSIKKILQLRSSGSNVESFLTDTMAPLLTSDLDCYKELKRDVIGV